MRISDWSSDVCSSDLSIAKQLTSGPVTWFGSVENLETFLGWPPLTSPYIVLLDGLPLPQLITTLDQNADFLKENQIILQITAPPVRMVVEIMQRGVRDVIQKPYTLARLRSALEELCGGRGRWHPLSGRICDISACLESPARHQGKIKNGRR